MRRKEGAWFEKAELWYLWVVCMFVMCQMPHFPNYSLISHRPTVMPLCSIEEWRARIGSCWCALGRPVEKKASNQLRIARTGSSHSSMRHLKKLSNRNVQLNPTISLPLVVIFVIATTLLKSGDVEINPGPKIQTSKQVPMFIYKMLYQNSK